MKRLTNWVLLLDTLLLTAAILGVWSAAWYFVAAATLTWMILEALQLMHRTQVLRNESVIGENLKPESQALLRPIKKLAREMRQMVESKESGSAVAMVGKEILAESDRVVSQCAQSLAARDELSRLLRGKYDADKEIERVREAINGATSDGERQALESTLSSRTTEHGRYDEIETTIRKIDTDLRQAEAVLAEMKAHLAIGDRANGAAEGRASELRESFLRVKALTLSVDEAEVLING